MLDNDFFDDFTLIRILSDGGGKHFKTTAMMNFFGVVQMATGKTVEYNFFESYHGHSVCDAAAAHAKKHYKMLMTLGTHLEGVGHWPRVGIPDHRDH